MIDKNYPDILASLKQRIRLARQRAAIVVNTELLSVYWEIGNIISQQQKVKGWGKKIKSRLAKDLKSEFPDLRGLSERNLEYMQAFASAWPQFPIPQVPLAELQITHNQSDSIWQVPLAKLQDTHNQVKTSSQAPLAQLTWYHHLTLLSKIKDPAIRLFYVYKTIENGWSRNVMLHQIESQLHLRQGNAITNFEDTLPKPQSDLAKEALRNPYLFDFLGINDEMRERDMEKALMKHIKKFMLELGRGFAYVGNQFNLTVGDNEYFLDLLFYNFFLRRFVVFELKVGEFKPEFTGKLNFYINIIDEQIKGKEDNPTIGVLLCKTPNDTMVKYALKGIDTPIGVAEYEFTTALPKQLKGEMPTIEELEQELEKEAEGFKEQLNLLT